MAFFSKETKEQTFWKWFQKNEDQLFHFERDTEAIFDRLASALSKVHPDLTFEFGPIADGTREFVISAGGIREAFPHVESLHAAAPSLPKWKVLKYRQRRSPINDIEVAGRKVNASDVQYALFRDEENNKVNLMIFLDGYTEEEHDSIWGQFGYLFLDEALGEFDVETYVGGIRLCDRDSEYFEDSSPLEELPAHFDRVLRREQD